MVSVRAFDDFSFEKKSNYAFDKLKKTLMHKHYILKTIVDI